MNVTLLLRMVQKIGNSLIAFSPVLTRMSVAQIYGTGFTPSLKKTMALAGLMSLASVGAYASTKSAAEGEVNTPVEALIPMAKDYVNKYKSRIDADQSGTINNNEELNYLLTGTASNSIEDLITEDINKKLAEKDADKIFTTFMTTENIEQAQRNTEILNSCMDVISFTYDNIIERYGEIPKYMDSILVHLNDIEKYIKYLNFETTNNFTVNDEKVILNNLKEILIFLEEASENISDVSKIYKNITGSLFIPAIEQFEKFENAINHVNNQESVIITKDALITKRQVEEEVIDAINEVETTKPKFRVFKKQFGDLKENDIKLLQTLLEKQTEYTADSISSAEEQAASKELLKELVANASPMTRNAILELAEEQYKPENDPTGIVDISAGALSKMCFDLTGKQLAKPREGLNIVKSAEGTVQKVIVQ